MLQRDRLKLSRLDNKLAILPVVLFLVFFFGGGFAVYSFFRRPHYLLRDCIQGDALYLCDRRVLPQCEQIRAFSGYLDGWYCPEIRKSGLIGWSKDSLPAFFLYAPISQFRLSWRLIALIVIVALWGWFLFPRARVVGRRPRAR